MTQAQVMRLLRHLHRTGALSVPPEDLAAVVRSHTDKES